MEPSKTLILFFVKFADPGRPKTRISRVLVDETGGSHPLAVCFAPHTPLEAFKLWLGLGWRYLPQQGDHLGDRMKRAFQDSHNERLDLYRRGKGTHFARSKTMACLASILDTGGPGGLP